MTKPILLTISLVIILLILCFIVKLYYSETFTDPLATPANIITPITNSLQNGYTQLNEKRFTTIDNQIRLDNVNTRVNKLLENIQKIYNINNSPIIANDNMTFY
jgi:hypothetical protein